MLNSDGTGNGKQLHFRPLSLFCVAGKNVPACNSFEQFACKSAWCIGPTHSLEWTTLCGFVAQKILLLFRHQPLLDFERCDLPWLPCVPVSWQSWQNRITIVVALCNSGTQTHGARCTATTCDFQMQAELQWFGPRSQIASCEWALIVLNQEWGNPLVFLCIKQQFNYWVWCFGGVQQ